MKIKIFVSTEKASLERQCNEFMQECDKVIDVRFATDIVNMEGWYNVLILYE